jgi:hypothetical protein
MLLLRMLRNHFFALDSSLSQVWLKGQREDAGESLCGKCSDFWRLPLKSTDRPSSNASAHPNLLKVPSASHISGVVVSTGLASGGPSMHYLVNFSFDAFLS